jgi:prolyl-tRNA editing enzyme YbaK/EbsC (Cys-tRNA(Pro) deacylase)
MQPHERVQAALDQLAPGIQVHLMPESTATAPEAAAAAGCKLGAIVKSLLFVIDGRPVLVLVAGDQIADQKKLGGLYGVGKKKVRIADAETVRRATGFEVGGVPPIGHTTPLPVLIDQTLGRFETVWAAAGSRNAIFPIPFSRLVEITGGRVTDVARVEPAELNE